ncbi:L-lactate permease [Bradyrhizobium icense]|nr:L-lactate permease [Bradyrhizobium icense]
MEAVTGYGVGQVAAISALQRAGLRGRHLAIMALLSQTMVPWGAMANGTMVGATLSGLTPTLLGTYSAVLTLPLLAGWLAMFWRVARAAGVEANAVRHIEELCWIATIAILLVICNLAIGPESAGVTTLGALIALRFWLYERPSAARLRRAAKACVPYAALILGLLASRVLSGIAPALESVAVLKPLGNGPSLHPSTHPATWLVLIGCVTILSVKPSAMVKVAWSACQRGCRSVLAILLFLTMAKLMATSGMAEALGQGVRQLFGAGAPLTVPLLAGLFGFITGSGSASNGLLMPAQISLAREAYLDPGWIAAIQNVGAAALTMLSPARVATCCVLAGVPHLERRVYAGAWPFGGIVVAILVGVCAIMLVAKGAVPAMRWE